MTQCELGVGIHDLTGNRSEVLGLQEVIQDEGLLNVCGGFVDKRNFMRDPLRDIACLILEFRGFYCVSTFCGRKYSLDFESSFWFCCVYPFSYFFGARKQIKCKWKQRKYNSCNDFSLIDLF